MFCYTRNFKLQNFILKDFKILKIRNQKHNKLLKKFQSFLTIILLGHVYPQIAELRNRIVLNAFHFDGLRRCEQLFAEANERIYERDEEDRGGGDHYGNQNSEAQLSERFCVDNIFHKTLWLVESLRSNFFQFDVFRIKLICSYIICVKICCSSNWLNYNFEFLIVAR